MVDVPNIPVVKPTGNDAQQQILWYIAQQLHAIALILRSKKS